MGALKLTCARRRLAGTLVSLKIAVKRTRLFIQRTQFHAKSLKFHVQKESKYMELPKISILWHVDSSMNIQVFPANCISGSLQSLNLGSL